jgi:parallel beta-helix repeat protein
VIFTRRGRRGKPVTLRGFPGERARILGRLWIARTARYAVVTRLYLDGRNPKGLPSPTINASDVRFSRNDVTNHHTSICFLLGERRWGRANRALIERNRIHSCGELPAGGHDHGIYVEEASRAVIRNNWIYGNADYGVHLYPHARRTLVQGNIIYGNGMGVIFSGDHGLTSDDNVIEGNVIGGSERGYNIESWWPTGGAVGTGNVARHNCLWGGMHAEADGGVEVPQAGFRAVDNLIADPQFQDAPARDFTLGPTSACRAVLPDGTSSPGPSVALPRRH